MRSIFKAEFESNKHIIILNLSVNVQPILFHQFVYICFFVSRYNLFVEDNQAVCCVYLLIYNIPLHGETIEKEVVIISHLASGSGRQVRLEVSSRSCRQKVAAAETISRARWAACSGASGTPRPYVLNSLISLGLSLYLSVLHTDTDRKRKRESIDKIDSLHLCV